MDLSLEHYRYHVVGQGITTDRHAFKPYNDPLAFALAMANEQPPKPEDTVEVYAVIYGVKHSRSLGASYLGSVLVATYQGKDLLTGKCD